MFLLHYKVIYRARQAKIDWPNTVIDKNKLTYNLFLTAQYVEDRIIFFFANKNDPMKSKIDGVNSKPMRLVSSVRSSTNNEKLVARKQDRS